ncbi:MAG: PIG-L family deacetylase, partial [Planctomycetota bacterium]
MSCDLLVFAPHPDDAEIHFGASMARCVRAGGRVVLIDATAGEMGSRGDGVGRAREADAAATALGLTHRENLGLPDGWLSATDATARLALVQAIRHWRPCLIAAPHPHVSHPDHAACAQLAIDARKAAELHRLPGSDLPAWRGARLIAYEMELPI